MTKTIKGLFFVSILALSTAIGCESNDLYSECTLNVDSLNDSEKACATQANTCYVENFSQCGTRVCAKYDDSDAFCSMPCESDSECAPGVCIKFSHLDESKKFCAKLS